MINKLQTESNIVIYNDGELERFSTVAKNATVGFETGREIIREIECYNIDTFKIISRLKK